MDQTHVALTKRLIAAATNQVLSTPQVHIVGAISVPHQVVHKDINLAPAPSLNCRGNAGGCDIDQDCSLDPCSWNCGGWGPGRLGCEADKKRCQAQAAINRIGCEADKSRRKGQCEAQKAMEIAGCELNQGWLNDWGGKKVGHVDISADISGEADVLLRHLEVPPDLTGVRANLAFSGKAIVDADVTFVPAGIGNLACIAKWSGHVHASAVYQDQNLDLSGSIALEDSTPDRPASMTIRTPKRTVRLQVIPPPFQALVSQNPDLIVVCTPAVVGELTRATINGILGELAPSEFSGQYDYDIGPIGRVIEFKPIEVSLPESIANGAAKLQLSPAWQNDAIGFVFQK